MAKRGFTLIELLVVIVIVSVLAALLMPVLKKGRESAQASQCMHNMQQMGVASLVASQDNGNRLIGWYNYSTEKYWWQTLLTYAPAGAKTSIFQCPADKQFDPNKMAQTVSYAWNYLVVGRSERDNDLLTLPNFTKPASTLMITDSAALDSWGYIDTYGHSPDSVRHHGKTSALFLDGHVEALDTSLVTTAQPYMDRSKVTN